MARDLIRSALAAAAIVAAAVTPGFAADPPRTYYVDAASGHDTNPGTSPGEAWQSLAKVNAITFGPGDRVLLRAGGTWSGTLSPKGSGRPGRPIVVDKYGPGPLPRIDGAGATAAVMLVNQEHWEVTSLAITNDAPEEGLRRGVLIVGENAGRTLRHIRLAGLDISRVKGKLGAGMAEKTTGGIGVEARGTAAATRFDDLLIEDNAIHGVDNTGIYLWSESATHPRDPQWAVSHHTNVRVRRNRLSDIGKNAMAIRASLAPVIEHNVIDRSSARLHGNAIYVFGCKNAVIQFNEVSRTRFDGLEGAAFDSDYNSEGTVIQYNYSHDNGGGLVNLCSNPASKPPRGYNDGTIVRYNISQNETDRVIAFDGPVTSTQIYHNTIFVGPGLAPRIVEFDTFGKTPGYASGVRFWNNVIVNAGNGSYRWGESRDIVFEGNTFFGNHPDGEPADARKLMTDPLLAAPGTGGIGLQSVAGYRLRPGSPSLDTGVPVPRSPHSGGRDYFGAPVDAAKPDRGAIEGPADTGAGPGPGRQDGVRLTGHVPFRTAVDESGKPVSLTLDIYEPTSDTSAMRPAIVWVHGGGFRPGNDKRQGYIVTLSNECARRGFVSIAPDYRVRQAPDRDRPGTLREAVEDGGAALAWVREHAERLRIDPRRLVLAGGSAGGKLVVNLAAIDHAATATGRVPPLAALVVLWGSPEPSYRGPQPIVTMPPTLLVHGTKDVTVTYELSVQLAEELKQKHVPVEFLSLPDAAHTPVDRMPQIVETIAAFLARTVK